MAMNIIVILIAYLLGSIPSGLIVGKLFYGKDIREHGSGNLGGTNTFRTLGVKAGLTVTVADILKGTLAASLPFWFDLLYL
jgi:acyl phosphate:glycerol-3-phosphate acyltransferase